MYDLGLFLDLFEKNKVIDFFYYGRLFFLDFGGGVFVFIDGL